MVFNIYFYGDYYIHHGRGRGRRGRRGSPYAAISNEHINAEPQPSLVQQPQQRQQLRRRQPLQSQPRQQQSPQLQPRQQQPRQQQPHQQQQPLQLQPLQQQPPPLPQQQPPSDVSKIRQLQQLQNQCLLQITNMLQHFNAFTATPQQQPPNHLPELRQLHQQQNQMLLQVKNLLQQQQFLLQNEFAATPQPRASSSVLSSSQHDATKIQGNELQPGVQQPPQQQSATEFETGSARFGGLTSRISIIEQTFDLTAYRQGN